MCDDKTKEMLDQTVQAFIAEGKAFTGYDVTLATRDREKIMLRHRDVRGDIHSLPSLVDEVELGDYSHSDIDAPGGGVVILYHPCDYDITEYKFKDSDMQAGTNRQSPMLPAHKEGGDEDAKSEGGSSYVSVGQIPQFVRKPVAEKVETPKPVELPKPISADLDLAAALASTSVALPTVSLPSIAAPITPAAPVATGAAAYSLDMRGRLLLPFVRLMSLGLKTGSDVHLLPKPDEQRILVSTTPFDDPLENKLSLEREGIFISAKLLRIAGLDQGANFKVETVKQGEEKLLEVSTQ